MAGDGPDPGPVAGAGGLDVVQTGAWILPDLRPLPAELVAFLDVGTPPVYVGFGSMAMQAPALRAPKDIARVAIEAIRAQGRRALVSHGWADLALIDDRDDCLRLGEVNQQALFSRVAAVMHHGGAGTTTTATRAGAPQVVVPQAVDQPYWAGRVADLGIGTAHDGPTPTTESLSAEKGRQCPRQPRGIVEPGRCEGHVSTQGYEDELRSERSYVAGLYARLDAERARVKGEYSAALRGPIDQDNGGTLVERDAEVRALAKEVKRLDVADNGLCFGRLDTVSGEPFVHRPDRPFRRGQRLRTAVARLAGTGVARVLRRHRRQPGEHAQAPPVPHPRASSGRFHRRGARPPRRCRASVADRRGPARGGQRAAR